MSDQWFWQARPIERLCRLGVDQSAAVMVSEVIRMSKENVPAVNHRK